LPGFKCIKSGSKKGGKNESVSSSRLAPIFRADLVLARFLPRDISNHHAGGIGGKRPAMAVTCVKKDFKKPIYISQIFLYKTD